MSEGKDWRQEKRDLCPLITPAEWKALEDERTNTQVVLGMLLLNELRCVLEELGNLRGDVQDLLDEARRGNFTG